MIRSRRYSRRRFLARPIALAGSIATLPVVIPAWVLAAPNRAGANDRIGVGYIGAGRRANQLMNLPPAGRIVAAADCAWPVPRRSRLGDSAAPIRTTGSCWTRKISMRSSLPRPTIGTCDRPCTPAWQVRTSISRSRCH